MALDIDTRRPLRRPAELARLLRTILEGDPNDESIWLEWKRRLDLTSAAGRFHLAKGILGLSNRMPAAAAVHCGGVGYIVIGVEPGNLEGVAPIDPAKLDDGLSPYLGGARGPSWGAQYIQLDRASTLIVTVEPPRVGDPIYTLRKTYGSYAAGTVFVRGNGKTAPADDHDMDLLQTRLRAATNPLELDVGVAGDVPLSWFDPSTVEPAIQEWVEARRLALIAEAERTERLRRGRDTFDGDTYMSLQQRAASFEQFNRLFNPLVEQDERTLEDYAAEVEAWAGRLADSAKETWPARYLRRDHGVIRLTVANPTDRNLREILIKATFPGEEVDGLDDLPYVDRLPSPPRSFGEPIRMDFRLPIIPRFQGLSYDPPVAPLKSTWVEDGSLRIGWAVGDLRPRQVDESDDVYVFVGTRPEGGVLRGTWEATSKSTDGVLTGELVVPVSAESIDVGSLFALDEVAGS